MPSWLATHCPRLHAAHQARLTELRAEAQARRDWRARDLELQRLVAHRELQEMRAAQTLTRRPRGGLNRYVTHRADKLEQARRMLAQHRARRPEGT